METLQGGALVDVKVKKKDFEWKTEELRKAQEEKGSHNDELIKP